MAGFFLLNTSLCNSHADPGLKGSPSCCPCRAEARRSPRTRAGHEGPETEFLGPAEKPQFNPRGPVGALSWAVCPAETTQSNFLPSW